MRKLDFLEISRNFKSYYRTLRDVHYYLSNDSELNQEELQAVTKVLSKLIYGFIRIKGTSFREMDREQFEQEFNLFHQDFLNVIQSSGENNVDFGQFTALIDEIIGIAVMRTHALGKIKRVKQEPIFEEDEMEEEPNFESVVSDEEDVTDHDEVVEVIKVMNEIQEAVPVVETVNTELKAFNTKLRTFSTDFKTFSTEVETVSPEVTRVQNEIGNAEDKKPKPGNEVVVADEVNEVKVDALPPKVNNNFVDAAPVANKFNDYESSDPFRFKPRKRKNR